MASEDVKAALWEVFKNLPPGQQLATFAIVLVVAGMGLAVGRWAGGVEKQAEITNLEGQLRNKSRLEAHIPNCNVIITSPENDEKVPQAFTTKAVIQGISEDFVPWVVTTDSNHPSHYWPQSSARKENGIWIGDVHNIGGHIGKRRSFAILLVGHDGQLLIEAWQEGWVKGREPLNQITHDTVKCAERNVIVNEGERK